MPTESTESLKIVVVDDSDFSRKNVIKILEDAGFEIVGEANSAETALNLLASSDANLFLIDVVMPNASGIDLAQMIIETGKAVRLIMMSSLKMDHIVIESISNGAIDFLAKPFTSDELLASVVKVQSLLHE